MGNRDDYMNVIVLGINHRTAPLEVREKLWFSSEEMSTVLPLVQERWFTECFMVSTCNRTEICGVPSTTNGNLPRIDSLGQYLIDSKSATGQIQQRHLYLLRSATAVNHFFKVASGIDSMIVGDFQIVNQIKEGFKLAQEKGTVGPVLNRLVQSAYHASKRVRNESRIGEGAVSVSYAAVELATKIFADFSKKSALLIGAGETGELTARHLAAKGIGKLWIANRTYSKAEQLTQSLGGTAVEFNRLNEAIAAVDIIITSVESPQAIITAPQLSHTMKERSHKPLCIIDIGVPRNVDPAANAIENIFLYDVDALSNVVDQNLKKRESEIPKVNPILLEELKEFHEWYSALDVSPTIADLYTHFEEIRNSEVAKHLNRFSTQNDKELLDLVTKRIMKKLLHIPTTMLKNGHDEPGELKYKKIHLLRALFGLNKNERKDT
ncbi:MAG: glutamyl-tRNA reductase [Ignavibacteriae bacterium]|nr:glutamyl-tRNA reductase [Ignavibacteriota bacterium]